MKESSVSEKGWYTTAFCWRFPFTAALAFVLPANFSHVAVSSSVHMILVFLLPPRSRHIACFSPVEWKAEVVVSLSYLVSKCHHHLSVSIALIYLFIGAATPPPPSSHFFSCNISRLLWISGDYIQQFECTNQKHASKNSLMETQLQSLIFIYRLLETKQNREYYFFSLVFFWEISL